MKGLNSSRRGFVSLTGKTLSGDASDSGSTGSRIRHRKGLDGFSGL